MLYGRGGTACCSESFQQQTAEDPSWFDTVPSFNSSPGISLRCAAGMCGDGAVMESVFVVDAQSVALGR